MLKRIIRPILHLVFLVLRPLTLGVRGICYDQKSETILLVRHTYSDGWALPGGGVEVGESVKFALERELEEEVGLICGRLVILGLYFNQSISKRDHVAIYLVESWVRQDRHVSPTIEIASAVWFPIDQLPPDLTPCTKFALEEYRSLLTHQTNRNL